MVNSGNGFEYPQSDMKTTSKRKPEGDVVYSGRWTQEEHDLFILGLNKFGRDWKNVAGVVKTRSPAQIRSHAQKYFAKLQKSVPSSYSGTHGEASHSNEDAGEPRNDSLASASDGDGFLGNGGDMGSRSPGSVSEVELSALQALISWQADDCATGNNDTRYNASKTNNGGNHNELSWLRIISPGQSEGDTSGTVNGSSGVPPEPQRRHSLEKGGKQLQDMHRLHLHQLQGLVSGSKKRSREHVFGHGAGIPAGENHMQNHMENIKSDTQQTTSVTPSPNCPLPPSWLKSMMSGVICPPGQLEAFSSSPHTAAMSRLEHNDNGLCMHPSSTLSVQSTPARSNDEIVGFGGGVLPSVSHLIASGRPMSPQMSPRTSAFAITGNHLGNKGWDENLTGSAMTTLVDLAESQQFAHHQEFRTTGLLGRQRSVSLGEEAQIWFGRKLGDNSNPSVNFSKAPVSE